MRWINQCICVTASYSLHSNEKGCLVFHVFSLIKNYSKFIKNFCYKIKLASLDSVFFFVKVCLDYELRTYK